jgi:hypothetical protein
MVDHPNRPSDVPTGSPDEAYPDDGRDAPPADRDVAEHGARRNQLDEPDQQPEDVSESSRQ